MSELHVCATTSNGKLFHTIRRPDGSWDGFGDVEGQAGDIGRIRRVSAAVAVQDEFYSELHVCATTSNGKLFHTIQRPDGSWFGFGDVEGQAGDIGNISGVAAGSFINFGVHVCATTSNGKLFHTIRRPDGSWDGFGDVEGQAGDIGDISRVAAAEQSVGTPGVHVCATTSNGKLFHTIRRPDGSWFGFGDVEGQAGDIGNITGVAAAAQSVGESGLHVFATSNGKLFYTIRRTDGWKRFAGLALDIGRIRRVAVADTGRELHVCATTSDGKLFHTIRRIDGSWDGFGDVEGQAGDIGNIVEVAIDG